MKRTILIIAILFTTNIFSQGYIPDELQKKFRIIFAEWKSEWSLVKILNVGDETCLHEWVKQNINGIPTTSCSALHDSRGCPSNWGKEEWICKKCLRNVVVYENRILVPEKERPKSEFDILKEKIKGKK